MDRQQKKEKFRQLIKTYVREALQEVLAEQNREEPSLIDEMFEEDVGGSIHSDGRRGVNSLRESMRSGKGPRHRNQEAVMLAEQTFGKGSKLAEILKDGPDFVLNEEDESLTGGIDGNNLGPKLTDDAFDKLANQFGGLWEGSLKPKNPPPQVRHDQPRQRGRLAEEARILNERRNSNPFIQDNNDNQSSRNTQGSPDTKTVLKSIFGLGESIAPGDDDSEW